MKASFLRIVIDFIKPAVLISALVVCGLTGSASAEPSASMINAFFLNTAPTDYVQLEKLFLALKKDGANTIILKPEFKQGRINRPLLTNEVFIAHQFGLRLFLILPTRGNGALLADHPDWEDLRYELKSGSLQRTGRVDLFQQQAVQAVSALYKDVAAYSVDGILLSEDFYYGATEGMSSPALAAYKRITGTSFDERDVFGKAAAAGKIQDVEELGVRFWNWTELKKDALLNLFRAIVKAAWSANPKVKIGIPLHVEGLITPKDELARFGYDMNRFRRMNVDYYWMAVPHRDIRAQQDLSYNKSMEILSRIVNAATTIMKDQSRSIIAVQTTDQSGKILPLSEIEEATGMIKQAGEPGIAFMINADTTLPAEFTQKTFRRK